MEKGIELIKLANHKFFVIAKYPVRITGVAEGGVCITAKAMIAGSIFAEDFIEPIPPKEGVRYKGKAYQCIESTAEAPVIYQTFRFHCQDFAEALSIMRELVDKIPDLVENRCSKEAIRTGSYPCKRDARDISDENCLYQYNDCPRDL